MAYTGTQLYHTLPMYIRVASTVTYDTRERAHYADMRCCISRHDMVDMCTQYICIYYVTPQKVYTIMHYVMLHIMKVLCWIHTFLWEVHSLEIYLGAVCYVIYMKRVTIIK